MKVNVKKLHEKAVIPSYATEGDGCLDLTCVSIEERETFIQYNTGLAFEIPIGYAGLLFPRSSITKKDLMLKNSVGVIDAGYRGEISFRFKTLDHSTERWSYTYEVGDRVGQMMIIERPEIELIEVEELSDSERGKGGYGSTGA